MPLRSKAKNPTFDVPIQDVTLRVSAPRELYEHARASGMHFWEQLQSYAVRHPEFTRSTSAVSVPDDAPEIIKEMARHAARAGVPPMSTFRGALTQFVGQALAGSTREILVSCGGDYFVRARRRARLVVHPGGNTTAPLALVIKPELGAHGIYSSRWGEGTWAGNDLVVVARSCVLADAAAAAARAILSKPNSFYAVLSYLQRMEGLHGAMVIRDAGIGLAGGLEIAA